MRHLKKKIARALSCRLDNSPKINIIQEENSDMPTILSLEKKGSLKRRKRIPGYSTIPETSRATKNIVKNYGKAICNFATSQIAIPYLTQLIKDDIQLTDFVAYVSQIKESIRGLHHFRSILIENNDDSPLIIKYKKLFKEISEVFIKYFSVNWIFSGKVLHKQAHLKFRFKMLRRIRCPELFTYLKNPIKDKDDANKNQI